VLSEDVINLLVLKIVRELEKKLTNVSTLPNLSTLEDELRKTRFLIEMIHFSKRENIYAIARQLGLGSEIYFAAESGDISPGGTATWTYLVPDKQVDVAESLGYDPSVARVINFKWDRDSKLIYEDPKVVRRENVRVYEFSDEAKDYCKIIVENTDTVNANAIHVWGYCHFIDQFFYDLIKRRVTETYPKHIFEDIYKMIERRVR